MVDERPLGQPVQSRPVRLTLDSDFVDSINPPGTPGWETWPASATLKLVFDEGTEFVATVTTDSITWNIDKAVVNTLIENKPGRFKAVWKDGGQELIYFVGPVIITDL